MLFYTYLHRRASDNLPFYIGKGKGCRVNSRKNRSPYWHHVAEKHGLKTEVVAHWSTEAEAFEHEKFLIWCFRDMGFSLVNLSDGGEGQSGYQHTAETKRKLSIAGAGRKPTTEQLALASARMLGNKHWAGKKHTEEAKQKISAGNKGKLSGSKSPRFGKPIPESQKLAISKATSGAQHHMARPVLCIETGTVYDTCGYAAQDIGQFGAYARTNIAKAANGTIKTAYGKTWKYL